MKKVRKIVCCSRCGDEISVKESAQLHGTVCALCSNMQLESQQILQHKRKSAKSEQSKIYLVASPLR